MNSFILIAVKILGNSQIRDIVQESTSILTTIKSPKERQIYELVKPNIVLRKT